MRTFRFILTRDSQETRLSRAESGRDSIDDDFIRDEFSHFLRNSDFDLLTFSPVKQSRFPHPVNTVSRFVLRRLLAEMPDYFLNRREERILLRMDSFSPKLRYSWLAETRSLC